VGNLLENVYLEDRKVYGRITLRWILWRYETDHSLPSSAEVKKCVELYFHSPNMPSWRGAQFKKTGTGATSPLPYGDNVEDGKQM
jgi:hypothetical protein